MRKLKGSTVKIAIANAIDGVTTYIAGLTGWHIGLNVVFNNTVTASTSYLRDDGRRTIKGEVSLPVIDDDTLVSQSVYDTLIAYTAHEILHPLLTNWETFQSASQTGWGDMLNCGEDVYIEAHNRREAWQSGGEAYLGVTMDTMCQKAWANGYHADDPDPSQVGWTIKVLGYIDVVGYPAIQKHRARVIAELDRNPELKACVTGFLALLEDILKEHKDTAVADHLVRTLKVLDALKASFPRDEADNPKPPPPPPPTNPGGDDEGDEGDTPEGDEDTPEGDEDINPTNPGGDDEGDPEGDEGDTPTNPGGDEGDTPEGDEDTPEGDEGDAPTNPGGGGSSSGDTPPPPPPPDLFDELEEELTKEANKRDKEISDEGLNPSNLRSMFRAVPIIR